MIIDGHVHLWKFDPRQPERRGGLEVLVKGYMDKREVDKAVILGLQEPAGRPGAYSIYEILELSKKYGDRFIPFCGVDWRWDPEKTDKVRQYIEMGCKGCGELDHGLVVDDARLMPIYKVCGELGIPVLLHIGGYPFNPDLAGLERILSQFPQTNIIAHGPGWWTHISGNPHTETKEGYPYGYAWGKVEPGGKVERILKMYPNVYGDLSAMSGLTALQRDFAHARDFLEKFKDRIMYGTDFPVRFCNLPNEELFGVDGSHLNFIRALRLSQDTYEKITHENIEKLLKLK